MRLRAVASVAVGVLAGAGAWFAFRSPPLPAPDATPTTELHSAESVTVAPTLIGTGQGPSSAPAASPTRGAGADRAGVDARPATRIEGRVVTQEGVAVSGVAVRVILRDTRRWPEPQTTTSDAQGQYRLNEPPLGEVRISARGNGWVSAGLTEFSPAGHDPLVAMVERDAVTHMDLVVVAAARVLGRVTDDGGRGIAEALVEARARRPRQEFPLIIDVGGAEDRLPAQSVRTDAQGAYVLDGLLAGSEYRVEASAPSLLAASSPVLYAAVDPPSRADLVLRSGRFVDVTVLVADDRTPIADARVFGDVEGGESTRVRREPDRWVTDAAGRARIGPFDRVAVKVSVQVDGYLDDRKGHVEARVVPPEQAALEVRLGRGLAVSGRVLLPDGGPAVGAQVQAQKRETRPDGWSLRGFDVVFADAEGRFRITGLPEGTISLEAKLDRKGATTLQALVDAASGSGAVLITLGRDEERFILKIFGPDGLPVPKATVTGDHTGALEAVGGRIEIEGGRILEEFRGIEVTDPRDEQGRRLPLASARLTLPERSGGEIEVQLKPERPIAGRIVGPDEVGVAEVHVRVKQTETGQTGSALTDETGAFQVRGVPAGTYALTLEVPGTFIRPRGTKVESGAEPLLIRLRVGVRPTVKVLDPRGLPVAEATILAVVVRESTETAADDEADLALFRTPLLSTAADGTRQLQTLDPLLKYRVRVRPPNDRTDLTPYQVDGWKPADATVRLAPGFVVTGVVQDPQGNPVDGAIVRSVASNGATGTVWARNGGRFEIRDLPAGDVRLSPALGNDFTLGEIDSEGAVTTVAAGTRDVALVVDPGLELRVRVENLPEGAATLEAVLQPETEWPPKNCHPGTYVGDGLLRFRGLRAAVSYVLWVKPGDKSPDLSLLKRGLRASRDEVRLRLLPGRTIHGKALVPPGFKYAQADVTFGQTSQAAEIKKDGGFEFRGVPEGLWTISAWASDESDTPWVGTVETSGGDSVEVPMHQAAKDER